MLNDWINRARDIGFDVAAPCKIETLKPMPQIRDMCAADRCMAYGKNWTCPPHCGTIEECAARIQAYRHGILLQTVGHMKKRIDTRGYRETEERHLALFQAFVKEIRQEYPEALALGAGGCRICKQCAYPERCRFPEQATSSMEGYGLFVTQVCKDNNVPYYYGEKTIAYSACILF